MINIFRCGFCFHNKHLGTLVDMCLVEDLDFWKVSFGQPACERWQIWNAEAVEEFMKEFKTIRCSNTACDPIYLDLKVEYDGKPPTGFDNHLYKVVLICRKCGERTDLCRVIDHDVVRID